MTWHALVLAPLLLAPAASAPPATAPQSAEEMAAELEALVERLEQTGDDRARDLIGVASEDVEQGHAMLAVDKLGMAELAAESEAVRAVARFNAAQALYAASVAEVTQGEGAAAMARPPTLQERLPWLKRSASSFARAARLDPGDAEAARHTQRVREEIRRVEEEIERREEIQRQMEELADRLQDLSEQQQDQSESEAESAERQEEQRETRERTDDAGEDVRELDQGSAEQEAARQAASNEVERARQLQREAAERLAEGEDEGARESQREASDALERAAELLRSTGQRDQEPGRQGDPEQQPQDAPGEQDEPGEDEQERDGESVAEQLIEREESERNERRARNARPIRVERDW
ncbi:MAG: hypothetical protein AAFR38_02990 [Planctomycetota bacterium]